MAEGKNDMVQFWGSNGNQIETVENAGNNISGKRHECQIGGGCNDSQAHKTLNSEPHERANCCSRSIKPGFHIEMKENWGKSAKTRQGKGKDKSSRLSEVRVLAFCAPQSRNAKSAKSFCELALR